MVFEVSGLTAGYRHAVISELSFGADAGELVCILGRNGQGKTTIFRAIAGNARRFAGTVCVNGRDCFSVSLKHRASMIAFMPQRASFPPGLRVRDLLRMGRYPHGGWIDIPRQQEDETIEFWARELGITSMLDRDGAELSAGQQQMVLLCRLMIQDTPVVLLDEPDGALDWDNTHRMFQILRRTLAQKKKAGVVILHDPQMALRWCDRVLLLNEGRLIEELTPASDHAEKIQSALNRLYPDLRVHPHPYTAGFLCDWDEGVSVDWQTTDGASGEERKSWFY